MQAPYPDGHIQQWIGPPEQLSSGMAALKEAVGLVNRPLYVVDDNGHQAVTHSGTIRVGQTSKNQGQSYDLQAYAPPLPPSALGDVSFKADLKLRYPYIVGAMANGITSVEMVKAAGEAGFIGFLGAGGLTLGQLDAAINGLLPYRGAFPFGFNLIHSPGDSTLEEAVVDLYLRRGIDLVSASAYLTVTLPLVYYRVKGIHQTSDGRIVCPNRVVAKVSRTEVASKFFAPPDPKILKALVEQQKISEQEAQLAQFIPLAQDMTAEADSGGHTDNRPALALLPTFLALRNDAMREHRFSVPLRVGLGGGIATPDAAAAAFSMGAAYILTGSINQACVEADTSDTVRQMLVQAKQADVIMAPAADMFELGAKVQVLKRGTMFAMRATRLYELYRTYDRYDLIPSKVRTVIERDMLRASFEEAWSQTCSFFQQRDPSQISRAEQDPKHQMALVFRSYLGQTSLWAKTGESSRKIDYQIWCGPAMGAFNAWAKGSFLEPAENRQTGVIALNLLYGAAGLTRCHWLRSQGVQIAPEVGAFRPLSVDEIERRLLS